MIGLIAIACIALLVIVFGFFRPMRLLILYAAFLPLFGVIAEVGLQVTPFLVVAVAMGLVLLTVPRHIRLPQPMLPYLFYALAITFIMSQFLPDTISAYPPLRGQYRWISQLLAFTLLYLPIIYGTSLDPKGDDVLRMVRLFLIVSVLLAFSGIVQLIVFRTSGTDPFPINLFSGSEADELRSGLSRISAKEKILRMSGLGAGEPKHFGYTLVIAFSLNLLAWLNNAGVFRRFAQAKHGLIALLFAICILLSLSTQAYLLFAIHVTLITGWWIVKRGLLNRRSLALAGTFAIGLYVLTTSDYTRRLIELRLFERLAETGAVEDFNQTIGHFMVDNPEFMAFGTGLGNVHFWAGKYIPKAFTSYMRNSVFVAKSGFLRVLSELGIAGVILFVAGYLSIGLKGWRRSKGFALPIERITPIFLGLVMVSFIVTSDASPYHVFAVILVILSIRAQGSSQHTART